MLAIWYHLHTVQKAAKQSRVLCREAMGTTVRPEYLGGGHPGALSVAKVFPLAAGQGAVGPGGSIRSFSLLLGASEIFGNSQKMRQQAKGKEG